LTYIQIRRDQYARFCQEFWDAPESYRLATLWGIVSFTGQCENFRLLIQKPKRNNRKVITSRPSLSPVTDMFFERSLDSLRRLRRSLELPPDRHEDWLEHLQLAHVHELKPLHKLAKMLEHRIHHGFDAMVSHLGKMADVQMRENSEEPSIYGPQSLHSRRVQVGSRWYD
jgi:hypothetical protein